MNDTWIPITLINQSKAEKKCRFLSVTRQAITKLKMIRPGVYFDDPRLTLVKDLPTPEPEITITPEANAATEKAFELYRLTREAGERSRAAAMQPPQPKPMTFEEQMQHDWRFNPGIRKEFASYDSFLAYKRAEKAGKVKCYGKA